MAYDIADMIIYRQRDDSALVLDAEVGGISRKAVIPVGKSVDIITYSLLENLAKVGVKEVRCAFSPSNENTTAVRWQDGGRKRLLKESYRTEIDELLRRQASELSRKDKSISVAPISQTVLPPFF